MTKTTEFTWNRINAALTQCHYSPSKIVRILFSIPKESRKLDRITWDQINHGLVGVGTRNPAAALRVLKALRLQED